MRPREAEPVPGRGKEKIIMQPSSEVLLVEDDPQMLEVLSSLLAEERIQLTNCRNAQSALELVARKQFDLVVLDLGLPGTMDGFEALRQLKADPATQTIPVIILTAWNRAEDKIRGFELGACDYLTKPFDAAELRARLWAALRTHHLQEELTQTNRELLAARLTAEASARTKAEFLATMSHEIRTPMNGVIAMSSLLMDTPLNREQRGYVETIHTCSESLLNIINEILDLSKIESGKFELEMRPFDLRHCIENALDVLAPKAAEKKIDLAYQMEEGLPDHFLGDGARLKQVLVNLISNGIKFTSTGEVFVQVKAHSAPAGEKKTDSGVWQIHFAVRDTGIGIPPDRLARLFKPFTQADASTARQFGGTGLGLAISKRLVDLMVGKLWVESVPKKGSTFNIVLPLEATPTPSEPVTEHLIHQIKGQRILVVDDNLTNCRILATQSTRWGMLPRATQSAAQAIAWLREGVPCDVAVLDMHMPEMDGLALAQEIRKLPGGDKLPLILLASVGGNFSSPEFTSVGFSTCLTKPVKPGQLLDTFAQVLSGHKVVVAGPTKTGKLDHALASRLPLRILLCDDNQINLKVALRILQQLGYKADTAKNGREAIEAMQRQPYDLVFMDVQMPEMDGHEATRVIRERQERGDANFKPSIVVIAITASVLQGDREKCLAAGMDDYLGKPVRPEDIRLIIERWGNIAAKNGATEHKSPDTAASRINLSSAAQSAPAGADSVDMGRLHDFADNDPDSLRELVTLYLSQTAGQLEQLEAALQKGDAAEVQRLAHSCAGASATCGMIRFAPLLRELEKQGHDRDLSHSADLFGKIRAEFGQIQNILNPHLAAQPSAPQSAQA